jgi:hypothetical protein
MSIIEVNHVTKELKLGQIETLQPHAQWAGHVRARHASRKPAWQASCMQQTA